MKTTTQEINEIFAEEKSWHEDYDASLERVGVRREVTINVKKSIRLAAKEMGIRLYPLDVLDLEDCWKDPNRTVPNEDKDVLYNAMCIHGLALNPQGW